MWIKKNNLLVNLEKFDALYQDTLHPENLFCFTAFLSFSSMIFSSMGVHTHFHHFS